MKLSKREKSMLIISGILLACVALYFLVIIPIHENYNEAKQEFDRVESQYQAIKSQVLSDKEMDAIVEDYRNQIEVLEAQFPSAVHLEQIIDVMFKHFNQNGIIINAITFSMNDQKSKAEAIENDDRMGIEKLQKPMSVEEILDEYERAGKLNTAFDIANDIDGEIDYNNISYLAISMNFISNYDVLKTVLEGLENLSLTTVTTNISVAKNTIDDANIDGDNNEVVVSLSLSIPFYYDNEKEKDYIYDYSFTKGADYIDHGPFEYDVIENNTSSDDSIIPNEAVNQINISPEFYLSLNSAASDLPAQSMSYWAMNNSELELNGNTNEKYTLNLTEQDGEIRFSYENSNGAYPSGGATMVLDQKNDDIIVKVFSSNRISASDDAEMTLFLNNDTKEKVVFYVFYDDQSNPRFNVIVNKGSFDIIRN